MSLENSRESKEGERLVFNNLIKDYLRPSDYDLFKETGDDIANIIAEKMLFLAAFAPDPASFAPEMFKGMTDLSLDQANRILAIACALGFISPQENTSRWSLGADAQRFFVSLCEP